MGRVGFVIEGISNLKVFGPLLHESSKYGIEPVLILSRGGGGKTYDIATAKGLLATFPYILPSNVHYYDDKGIATISKRVGLKAVVLINAYAKYVDDVVALNQAGIASLGLDYFVNSLYAAAWEGRGDEVMRCLEHLAERLVISDYFRDLEFSVLPGAASFADKFASTGTPISAVADYVDSSKAASVLGIACGKRAICVLTPNIRRQHVWSFYGWRTKARVRHVLEALRAYCDSKGYLLVIKGREKQWDTPLYRRYADHFLTDLPELLYPHTSAWLLSACDLMVHFGSMAVFEAAAARVPSLGIEVMAVDRLHHYMNRQARAIVRDEILSGKAGTLFNFKNVARSVSIDSRSSEIESLSNQLISARQDRDSGYSEYNERFFSHNWNRSTEAVLDRVRKYI